MLPRTASSRHAEAGVTLVEILVVLSIIAITTGAVMLRMGLATGTDDLTAAATSLALGLTAASDAAMASGEDRLVEVAVDSYRIAPAGRAAQATWHALPGLTLTRTDGGAEPIRLSSDAASPAFELRLSASGKTSLVWFDGLQAEVEAIP